MPLKHIFAPAKATPKSIMLTSPDGFSTILRDQLPISTWLVAGASTYALLSVLLPKSSIYLTACLFAFLSYRIVSTVLQVYGIIPNPAMAQVIPGKTTAQVPDVNGNFTTTPSKESVVVLLLGFKTNHPLGMLCPGYKETSDYFMNMLKSYDSPEGRREFGFLGMSSYLGTSAAASNEVMTISYWRNIEGLHAFAESPVHREAWDWWNRTAKRHPHLLIFHEIYEAQGSSHENIYYNAAPMLIGGTAYPVKSDDKIKSEWVTPLVEASRGVLASSRGRLGRLDQE